MIQLDDLKVGQSAERRYVFTSERVGRFADLAEDHAPVHCDEAFAQARTFPGRIVHGFFAGAIFSGLLGEELPGPNSVINSVSLKYHLPVPVGETVVYRVKIKQISVAVRAVVLDMEAELPSGKLCITGVTHCSFR